MARVQRAGYAAYRAALARAIHAADQDDDRKLGFLRQVELCVEQVLAQLGDFCIVSGFVYLVTEFGGFKHDIPLRI